VRALVGVGVLRPTARRSRHPSRRTRPVVGRAELEPIVGRVTAELDLDRLSFHEDAAVPDDPETHDEAKALQSGNDLGLRVIVEERPGDEYTMHDLLCRVVDDSVEVGDTVPSSSFLTVDGAAHERILEEFGNGRGFALVHVLNLTPQTTSYAIFG
jgi:hypothetical protein